MVPCSDRGLTGGTDAVNQSRLQSTVLFPQPMNLLNDRELIMI